MEINLSDGDDEQEQQPDQLQTIERALENPKVQGVLSAILEDKGIDPQAFGLPANHMTNQNDTEEVPMEDPDAEPEQDDGPDADDLRNMVGQLMQFKGEEYTMAELYEEIGENPEQVNHLLEQAGFR